MRLHGTAQIFKRAKKGSTQYTHRNYPAGKGPQKSAGLSFCVLVTTSPRRTKLGGLPRGMRSADTPPPPPAASAPPAGLWQEPLESTKAIVNQV
jgi:hypothetical protein